jgi:hypothetical protein
MIPNMFAARSSRYLHEAAPVRKSILLTDFLTE